MTAVMDPPKKGKTTQESARGKAKTAQAANAEYNEKVAKRETRHKTMQAHAASATIYRVSYKDEKVSIKYSLIDNNKNNDFLLTSDDGPCEAFVNALHSLAPHVANLLNRLESERKQQSTQMTVKTVIFTYKENGNIHAQISVTRQLATGHCFTFCTPAIPIESDDPAVSSLKKESPGMNEILRAVIDEAKAYIGGKRAQGTLAFPEPDEGQDEE